MTFQLSLLFLHQNFFLKDKSMKEGFISAVTSQNLSIFLPVILLIILIICLTLTEKRSEEKRREEKRREEKRREEKRREEYY